MVIIRTTYIGSHKTPSLVPHFIQMYCSLFVYQWFELITCTSVFTLSTAINYFFVDPVVFINFIPSTDLALSMPYPLSCNICLHISRINIFKLLGGDGGGGEGGVHYFVVANNMSHDCIHMKCLSSLGGCLVCILWRLSRRLSSIAVISLCDTEVIGVLCVAMREEGCR